MKEKNKQIKKRNIGNTVVISTKDGEFTSTYDDEEGALLVLNRLAARIEKQSFVRLLNVVINVERINYMTVRNFYIVTDKK